jgi:hypothetical protein
MKFKVGDTVITIKSSRYYKKGAIGVVVKAGPDGMLSVEFFSGSYDGAPYKEQWFANESKVVLATKLHRLLAGVGDEL